MKKQAELRADFRQKKVPYPEMADRLGVSEQQVRQLMAELIREAESGAFAPRRGVSHGTYIDIVEEALEELRA